MEHGSGSITYQDRMFDEHPGSVGREGFKLQFNCLPRFPGKSCEKIIPRVGIGWHSYKSPGGIVEKSDGAIRPEPT